MRTALKVAAVLSVLAVLAGYAAGFRLLRDPAGGLLLARKVSYGGAAAAAGDRPKTPLERIEILTPDAVIDRNLGREEFIALVKEVSDAAERELGDAQADYKVTLTVVLHPDRETDNVVEAGAGAERPVLEKLAAAADGVDAASRTRSDDVSVRLHFDTARRPRGGGRTAVFVPAGAEGPGDPVPDLRAEAAAQAAVAALARPPAAGGPAWQNVICNPTFWKRLRDQHPMLAGSGIPVKAIMGGTVMEGRAFLKRKEGALAALCNSGSFRKIMGRFAAGRARTATAQERQLVYALVPFEIKGKPVTVIEASGDILYVEAQGGLLWLDILSDYAKKDAFIGRPARADGEGEVSRYGLYRKPQGGEVSAASGVPLHVLQGMPEHLETTDRVPARLGVSFGFEFIVGGLAPGAESGWRAVIQHPAMTRPGSAPATRTEFPLELQRSRGAQGVCAGAVLYGFDDPYEVLKGRWTLGVARGETLVLSKDFTVGAAPAAPAAPADPARDQRILADCAREIGMLCNDAGEDIAKVRACLRKNESGLLARCARALH
ncbi:MAG: DUF3859 domain-containing protein [Elusimicrobia bacterium]|nr:DUF3859 domain-containing protein [Elusimicrobiota bacterium]